MANKELQMLLEESNGKIKMMVGDLNEMKYDIKEMLSWSDRIGSDEVHQLHQLVTAINSSLRKAK